MFFIYAVKQSVMSTYGICQDFTDHVCYCKFVIRVLTMVLQKISCSRKCMNYRTATDIFAVYIVLASRYSL